MSYFNKSLDRLIGDRLCEKSQIDPLILFLNSSKIKEGSAGVPAESNPPTRGEETAKMGGREPAVCCTERR